jgi:phosphate/sulfate permease
MHVSYAIFVAILLLFAVLDLVVGVSNDAVNFLNSAIGARVASRRTIMLIAAAGIALGAMFSSGMMEVARKGIMNPGMFMFDEVMIIFVAVMLTDVLLLDFFNTFGLPTSTTVSIVFELLGGAVAMAAYKIISAEGDWSSLPGYINQEEALFIISGIFISVLVAFLSGMIIQYFARLLFTFNYQTNLQQYGGVFSGLAITLIIDFILLKGLKGTSFIGDEFIHWVEANNLLINIVGFVFCSVLCHLLINKWRINVLRFIVLMGTFALAMAFASNDLVNFIGVPVAGLLSFQEWVGSGVAPDGMSMSFLSEEIATPAYLLVIAGVIMVTTLTFSKKARTVTATELDLGRQGVVAERFRPNVVSRTIVGFSLKIGSVFSILIPENWMVSLEKRFQQIQDGTQTPKDRPSFDLVRASVNLMVSSVLIAYATSLKLPLSTTYVTFMVAMGSSLSDRAWNRDTAVYRVAGVIHVISGWFFTALIAFSSAFLMVIFMCNTGIWGLVLVVFITGFFLLRSRVLHRKLEGNKLKSLDSVLAKDSIYLSELKNETATHMIQALDLANVLFDNQVTTLSNSKAIKWQQQKQQIKQLQHQLNEIQTSLFHRIEKMEGNGETAVLYINTLNKLHNVQQSARQLHLLVKEHVSNHHGELSREQVTMLKEIGKALDHFTNRLMDLLRGEPAGSFVEADEYAVIDLINSALEREMLSIKSKSANLKNVSLINALLLELRDLTHHSAEMVRYFNRL